MKISPAVVDCPDPETTDKNKARCTSKRARCLQQNILWKQFLTFSGEEKWILAYSISLSYDKSDVNLKIMPGETATGHYLFNQSVIYVQDLLVQ